MLEGPKFETYFVSNAHKYLLDELKNESAFNICITGIH